MNHQTEYLTSANELRVFVQRWTPDEPPRAVVSIVHGFSEHSGSYAHVIDHFLQQGYAVTAIDHQGFGQSDGQRGLLQTFERGAADLALFLKWTREHFPKAPYFVFAHSMGGAYTVEYLCHYEPLMRGALFSGPGIKINYAVNPLLKTAAYVLYRFVPRMRTIKTQKGLSTSDPAMQALSNADDLVFRGRVPVQTAYLTLNAWQHFEPILHKVNIPFTVFHGTVDMLADVDGSRALYRQASSKDKQLNLLGGFKHEVVNEIDRQMVLDAMVTWIEERL